MLEDIARSLSSLVIPDLSRSFHSYTKSSLTLAFIALCASPDSTAVCRAEHNET